MLRTGGLVTGLALAAMVVGGCAGQAGESGGAAPTPSAPGPAGRPESSVPPPTAVPPSAPPKTPSDDRRADWIAGRITRAGGGPCYGLVTDDGKVYALYSTEKMSLKVGDTVRVQVAPLRLKISCGEGTHRSAVTIVPVN